MEYFEFDSVGNVENENYCFVNQNPQGIGFSYSRLNTGEALQGDYKEDPFDVTLQFSKDYPGTETPFSIGNTGGYIIFDKKVKEVFKSFDMPEIEYLPFTLLDHEGKVVSKNHVFINPLGTYDCLDYKRTQISKTEGITIGAEDVTLSKQKLNSLPDLIRPKDIPYLCLFSRGLAEAIINSGFASNLRFLALAYS